MKFNNSIRTKNKYESWINQYDTETKIQEVFKN